MKYHIVEVYTGYNENSINGNIAELELHDDVAVATRERMESMQKGLLANGFAQDHIDEFYNHMGVREGVGHYAYGEEAIVLVIPETSVWYDRVAHEDSLYETHYQAWEELVWGWNEELVDVE